jgi:hypothetical protein
MAVSLSALRARRTLPLIPSLMKFREVVLERADGHYITIKSPLHGVSVQKY